VIQLNPRALGSLLSPLTTLRDYGGSILTGFHTGLEDIADRRIAGMKYLLSNVAVDLL
jgi:hypothetical protein